LPVNDIEARITKRTKLLIINSPNNPAGYIFTETFLSEVYSLARTKGIRIISDEVYEKLIFSGKKHFSIGSLEPEPLQL
jgi:aspartate aminotransferase